MKKIILSIDGMTCSACSNGLEKYLNKQNGINKALVNLVMANATIEYDEKKLKIEDLEQFVKEAGFNSLGEFKDIKMENKNKKEKIKFIVFTVLEILLMYIAMGHMINLPAIPFLDMQNHLNNYIIALLVLAIAFLWYGFDILKNGYKNLIHRTPNMDTLVGIGVLSSLLYSLYNMYLVFKGDTAKAMNLYFESVATVIYFIKLGRYIDGISKDKTKEAIGELVKITPNSGVIKVDGKEKVVTLDEIKKGDIVVSKPGEKIAVDGEIIEGKTHVDESFITGESKPVEKEVKDKVIAGSINYDGYIEYKAERIGKESTISEIVRLVVEASNTKASIAKIADKVSGIFVPVVIGIAIVTLIIYLLIGQAFGEALTTFVTILVVACPCSLGLATPLAIVISEGLCAKKGILVKKSEVLENAQKVNTVVFDKTGTLTYGKLKIAKIFNYTKESAEIKQNAPQESNENTRNTMQANNGIAMQKNNEIAMQKNNEIEVETDDKIMQVVGSIEAKSTHPISKAFTDYLEENKIDLIKVNNFENIAGMGIKANIYFSDNKEDSEKTKKLDEKGETEFLIGNAKILEKFNIKNEHENDEKSLAENGCSIVYVVKNKEIIALIGINDILRENSKEVVEELNKNNIQTVMLTGDNKETAEKIAKEIGITKVIANVLPVEKAETIKNLKKENKFVLMCGDGINDSPALTVSDIGVSINTGTDIAMDSSDVILTKNDLYCIINLMKISKHTIRNIKQNLFWAFFYNSLMIPIAIGVLKPFGIAINPMIASLAMVLSSITVILNALRLKRI